MWGARWRAQHEMKRTPRAPNQVNEENSSDFFGGARDFFWEAATLWAKTLFGRHATFFCTLQKKSRAPPKKVGRNNKSVSCSSKKVSAPLHSPPPSPPLSCSSLQKKLHPSVQPFSTALKSLGRAVSGHTIPAVEASL